MRDLPSLVHEWPDEAGDERGQRSKQSRRAREEKHVGRRFDEAPIGRVSREELRPREVHDEPGASYDRADGGERERRGLGKLGVGGLVVPNKAVRGKYPLEAKRHDEKYAERRSHSRQELERKWDGDGKEVHDEEQGKRKCPSNQDRPHATKARVHHRLAADHSGDDLIERAGGAGHRAKSLARKLIVAGQLIQTQCIAKMCIPGGYFS